MRGIVAITALLGGGAAASFHDSHFHLTNYVQEGTDIRDFLEIMGDRVGRSTLFGIPLQQTWADLIRKILDHVQQRAPPRLPPRRAESDTTYPDLFVEHQ